MATEAELAYLIRVNDRDLKELKRNVDTVNKSVDEDLGKASTSADSHLRKIGTAAKVAAAGVGILLVKGLKDSVSAAIDAQHVQTATETQLKALGISYKDHADQINNVIDSTSKLSALDDEDLQQSFTRLLPATHNVNKALDEMQLAADIARARHISLESATNLVTRANTGSAGALRRLGISLTATTENVDHARAQLEAYKKTHDHLSPAMEEHFKQLERQGKQMDKNAQAVTNLDTLHKTFAGAAKTYGESAAGAQERYQVALENVEEAIGGGLLPVLTQLLGIGTKILGFIQSHQHETVILIAAVTSLVAIITAVNLATKAWTAATTIASAATKAWEGAQWLLNAALDANPIGLVVIALAALGAALVIAWTKSETFRKVVTDAWDDVKSTATTVFNFITQRIPDALGDVLDWVKRHWPEIAVLISGPFAPIVALATNAFGVRSALEDAFRSAKNFVGDRIDDMVDFLRDLPGRASNAVQGLLNAAGLGPDSDFRRAFRVAADYVSDKVDDIVGFFRDLPGRAGDGVRHAAGDLRDAIEGIFGALPGWAKKILGISSPSKVFAEIGENVVHGFIKGIEGMGGKLKDTAVDMAHDALDAAGQFVDSAGNIVSKGISSIGGAIGSIFGGGSSSGGAPNVPGVTDAIRAAIGLAEGMGFGMPSSNQLTGGTHATNSYHYQGRAVDFGAAGHSVGQMESLFMAFYQHYGHAIRELFYDPMGWYVKDGQIVSGAIGGHSDHVHLALERGGVFRRSVTFGDGQSAPEVVLPLGSTYGRGILRDAIREASRAQGGSNAPLLHVENMVVRDDVDATLIASALSRSLAVRR